MPDRWGRACAAVALAAAALLAQTERKLEYRNVPAAVRAAFEKQFAGARVLGAAAETEAGATLFEIECEWRSRHHDITFREDGSLVSVEETIPMSEVPAAVAAALKKEFPKARVTRAEKISEGGTVAYEFQLQGAAKREAKFSADGRLISSE
ncbi:MAG: PepSY-like domain-containing protein [Bryobacteraceae bacterium]|nr:PepSY-like domain-containing protein [Bryobacteraceae bacterium]